MDIREVIDELYQLWAKTTGAEKTYWMPKEQPDDWLDDGVGGEYREPGEGWDLWSLNEEQNQELLGNLLNEVDANFITAIHGALPDLVRRTHEALDEADRLDEQRDEQEIRIAGLEETIDELNGRINELEHDLAKASK